MLLANKLPFIGKIKSLLYQRYIYWAKWGKLSLILARLNPCLEPAILIVSIPRSGSSWVGSTLGSAKNALYLREPINQSFQIIGTEEPIFFIDSSHAPTVCKHAGDKAFTGIPSFKKGVVANLKQWKYFSRNSKHLVIKEVNPLVCEWLIQDYSPKIILLIRHPAAVALSYYKMGWRRSIENFWEDQGSYQGHALQGCLNSLQHYSDHIVVQYETLCWRPLEVFKELFKFSELIWDTSIEELILTQSTSGNPQEVWSASRDSKSMIDVWKKNLTQKQIHELRSGYRNFNLPWYQSDEEW